MHRTTFPPNNFTIFKSPIIITTDCVPSPRCLSLNYLRSAYSILISSCKKVTALHLSQPPKTGHLFERVLARRCGGHVHDLMMSIRSRAGQIAQCEKKMLWVVYHRISILAGAIDTVMMTVF